ncbi:FAD linked oxidase domain-containing protein [Burkholderia multivorans]|uniref:FAD linked oxidase domain-containing protein n=2 Tax=Burkholderia multivorans TaxID=87883 RepID=A0ABD7LFE5_9BURK|nr:FAD-binding oxidoreductase [Burkholderia multivorans]SAK11755.1 FAD linked oxidase domain-containing protein [Burkholderia multivorans]SAK13255.1 FAD linked oxidase domain-containing protein [Burkholderia multivorans]HEF5155219.1 FAD-binding oxidoreductase [Burkholderia multivorans]
MPMPDTAAACGTSREARLSDAALEAALVAELGDACVTRAADIESRYFTAYNERPGVRPRALVRPRSVDEVSRALALCARLAQPVVPQGGLTGLARGAVALGGEVVLSMERFAGIDALDAAAGTLTVRAGTPLQVVQEAADAAGFTFGVDLGARGSCQIGGMLATNAGGTRAIRYGTMREQVLGLEAVLADGTVVSSMNRMLKNNAGYDLKQLFIGSEGTLGVVTRAVLRLHPKLAAPATALCRVRDYGAVVALWNRMRTLPELVSFEAMWPAFYDYVARHTPGVAAPFAADGGFAVLIECATSAPGRDARAALETALADAIDAGLADDAVLATSERQARDLWTLREGLAIDALPNLVNFDVSLPTGDLGAFAARCDAALRARWPDIVCLCFGHVGDGNVHIGVSLAATTDAGADEIDRRVYAIVREMGGSVSAEHGIGVLKRDYLAHTRSDAEIALMRTLKAALDPGGILNPGKVL